MRTYLANSMSGKINSNFAWFDRARDHLVALGHEVTSPADLDREDGITGKEVLPPYSEGWCKRLSKDIGIISSRIDALVLGPEWKQSVGARHEARTGLACGLRFFLYEDDNLIEVEDDYVARIALTADPATYTVWGLGHLARVGKDSVANVLVRDHGFQRVSFADALKNFVYAIDAAVAAAVDTVGWETAKMDPHVRTLLQSVGVEARKHMGENVWVDAVFRQFNPGGKYIVADVRFSNEVAAVLSAGGRVFRVDRPGYGPINNHISETILLEFDGWSGVIHNDGTLADLDQKVKELF